MYQGNNPTALQSQQWIINSLLDLMKEKEYQQITIRDICKKADLSRQTFYNIFEQKEDILRYCLQKSYQAQFDKLRDTEAISVQQIVDAFEAVLEEENELIQLMLKHKLDMIILNEIEKCVSLFANQFVKMDKRKQLPYSQALLSGALSYTLVFWSQQENPISKEELVGLIKDFLEGKLYEF